ncbi:ATP-dependent RNA helicase RhlB [hydrothermal vent metagenome]|uniref:ATP-dependent RNA helicase RhlB n=1 Tax=hydrothermal vent metagenome TaxID=652676 RepID=A0A3B1DC01_9ZZZZ
MSSKFSSLPIPPLVLKGIAQIGYTNCTPIQDETLPITLTGKDVAGQAQTGTGKTAAFLIALFTRLLEKPPRPISKRASPRAMIIAPTRELAVQIYNEAKAVGAATDFSILAVYGGVDYEKQRTTLSAGCDILIGTPGRLIDYFKQKVYDLRRVDVLVIDEADRMFDMGFIADLRYLLRRLPPYKQRQSMLFSATLSFRVMEMAYEHMNNPVKIEVTPEQLTAERIEQILFHVERSRKLSLLLGLFKRETWQRTLIFVNTKHQGETLARRLTEQGHAAKAITGDLPQKKRLRFLEQFKAGEMPILVATDVASRGLHIDGVDLVVNYDFPQDREAYVHRIGRTARAGALGKAISLADEEYVMSLEEVESYIGKKIPVEWPEDDLFIKPKYVPRPKIQPNRPTHQKNKTKPQNKNQTKSTPQHKNRPRRPEAKK